MEEDSLLGLFVVNQCEFRLFDVLIISFRDEAA
jgi:hypothetical protein